MLPEHLGGHSNVTNLDTGVLDWVIDRYSIKSFLDLGCGPGGMVEYAHSLGLKSIGIDGDYTLKRPDNSRYILHDFTTGPLHVEEKFGLGWTTEFVEHVEEKYIPNYMPVLSACKYMVMTYAPPGHGGHHHVNENTQEYWIETLAEWGFVFHENETNSIREYTTMHNGRKNKNFMKLRGMFFENKNF